MNKMPLFPTFLTSKDALIHFVSILSFTYLLHTSIFIPLGKVKY
uniref:Uncharacterized protein n=1 Tax=Rhizophora mucronata TaxID=61149 RepID=A0A2P2NDS9_RHIMU